MGNGSSGQLKIMSGKKPETPKVKQKEVVVVKPKESPKESSKESLKDLFKIGSKPKSLTKNQLEKWTSSINSLLSDEEGILAFRKFLEEGETEPGEHTKYLDFYQDTCNFKKKVIELEMEAERLYTTYLEAGSDLEIGTGKEGGKVGGKLEEGFQQKTLFDATQQKVKDKLDECHYVNFCEYLMKGYKKL